MKITYKMKLTNNKNYLRNAAAVNNDDKDDDKGEDEEFVLFDRPKDNWEIINEQVKTTKSGASCKQAMSKP